MRGERVVEKILEAAVEELAQCGYEALSFEAVAARAEVAKTTIYRRWPTKSDLAAASLERVANEIVDAPDAGSLRADLMALLSAFRAFAWSARGQSLMRMMHAHGPNSEVGELARRIREDKEKMPRLVIDRAIARGELPPKTDASLVLDPLFGALNHYLGFMNVPVDDEQLGRLITVILDGAKNGGAVVTGKSVSSTMSCFGSPEASTKGAKRTTKRSASKKGANAKTAVAADGAASARRARQAARSRR